MDTKKLRQKLLDLAIHGKLVPQDPNDEPASELLSRIHAEKLAMVERGELKPKDVQNDSVIYFGSDGLPYEKRADGKDEAKCIENSPLFMLPEGWVWARLGSLSAQINYGVSNSAERNGSHKLLRITDIDQQKVDWNSVPYTTVDEATAINCKVSDGDILFARIGATVGKTYLATGTPRNTVYASYLIRVQALLCDAHYLINFFDAPYYWEEIGSNAVGSGRPNVNGTVLSSLFVPVPPLAEQRRIVDALDKYLALVDEIERDRAGLDGLFAQLKSKVLDLAVRGELTERDPGDEPASELLARIREDKLAMVERGELKPKDVKGDTVIFTGSDGLRYEKRADGKGEAKCIEKEIPFEVPEGWAWARLGTVCSLLRRGKSPVYTDDASIPVFAQKCNQPWGITLEKVKFLNRSALDRYGETLKLRSGDIVVNSTGTGTLGRVGVFDEGLLGDYPFIVPDSHVAVVRIIQPFESKYIFHLLRSEYGQGLIFSKQTGSTNQKELPAKEIALFLIPVPPLAEQWRIVKRIEKLFNLLD